MAYSEAQKRATAKYNAGAYDRIEVKVLSGKKKLIQEHVNKLEPKISVNAYINRLIENDMKEEAGH